MDATPRFDAYIGRGDVALEERDVMLLRTIASEGSLNAAADNLGRSFAHAHRRIDDLEAAFGPLLERRTGGAGGGGSELTDAARELLAAFDRLRTGFEGVAEVAETVLHGTVRERDGELATVGTVAGEVYALVPEGDPGTEVDLVLRADAVTLHEPGETPLPGATSARNRFLGKVLDVDPGKTIARVRIDVGTDSPLLALVSRLSLEKLDLDPGDEVVASFKATATRGVPI